MNKVYGFRKSKSGQSIAEIDEKDHRAHNIFETMIGLNTRDLDQVKKRLEIMRDIGLITTEKMFIRKLNIDVKDLKEKLQPIIQILMSMVSAIMTEGAMEPILMLIKENVTIYDEISSSMSDDILLKDTKITLKDGNDIVVFILKFESATNGSTEEGIIITRTDGHIKMNCLVSQHRIKVKQMMDHEKNLKFASLYLATDPDNELLLSIVNQINIELQKDIIMKEMTKKDDQKE